MYYNNYPYVKFGVDTFTVTGNISGHFDVYLSILNNLNVTENLITTSDGYLPISNDVSVTENVICI